MDFECFSVFLRAKSNLEKFFFDWTNAPKRRADFVWLNDWKSVRRSRTVWRFERDRAANEFLKCSSRSNWERSNFLVWKRDSTKLDRKPTDFGVRSNRAALCCKSIRNEFRVEPRRASISSEKAKIRCRSDRERPIRTESSLNWQDEGKLLCSTVEQRSNRIRVEFPLVLDNVTIDCRERWRSNVNKPETVGCFDGNDLSTDREFSRRFVLPKRNLLEAIFHNFLRIFVFYFFCRNSNSNFEDFPFDKERFDRNRVRTRRSATEKWSFGSTSSRSKFSIRKKSFGVSQQEETPRIFFFFFEFSSIDSKIQSEKFLSIRDDRSDLWRNDGQAKCWIKTRLTVNRRPRNRVLSKERRGIICSSTHLTFEFRFETRLSIEQQIERQ